MMGIFARLRTWKKRTRKAFATRPVRLPRPGVELLETRVTPATLTVGTGQLYLRLQDALGVANAGDTIQIEPGAQVTPATMSNSTLTSQAIAGVTTLQVSNQNFTTPLAPGEVIILDAGTASAETDLVTSIINNNNSSNTSTVVLGSALKFTHSLGASVSTTGTLGIAKNVTIIGDQAFVPSQLPEIGPLWIADTTGVKLLNVNLSDVTLLGSGTEIMDSMIQGNITNQVATNSEGMPTTLTGQTSAIGNGTSGGSDVISNNTILGSIYLANTSNELISFNTMTGTGVVLPGAANFADKIELSGDTNFQVFDNTLELTATTGIATNGIFVNGGTGNIIRDNHIALSANSTADNGIEVSNANQFGVQSNVQVDIRSNSVSSNGLGTGLLFNGIGGFTIASIVQGNDFRGSAIGVELAGGNSASTLAGVDLGSSATGSATASLGGNDFRTYTGTGTTSNAAIVLLNVPSGFTLNAQYDMFNPAINPQTVVVGGSNGGAGGVNVGNNLNANQEFVQSLFATVLGRVGNQAELSGWVNLLPTGGRQAIANAIVHSAEADGIFLTQIYRQLLGRDPDSQGLAFFTNYLESGGTRETVTTFLVSSQEYRFFVNRPQMDFNNTFIESLYSNLMDRQPTNAELSFWTSQINKINYSGIAAAIANSPEHQQQVIKDYYMTVLHRNAPPTPAELTSWTNTNLDLLTIEALMLGSQEFFQHG